MSKVSPRANSPDNAIDTPAQVLSPAKNESPKTPRKRSSDTFKRNEFSIESPTSSSATKIRRTSPSSHKAISNSTSPTCMRSNTAIVLDDSEDESRGSIQGELCTKPSAQVVSFNHEKDWDIFTLKTAEIKTFAAEKEKTSKSTGKSIVIDREMAASEEVQESELDRDMKRFLREAKERKKRNAQRGPGQVVKVLLEPRIPNTKELLAQVRTNQELRILLKTWGTLNNMKEEEIFLTWRGNQVYPGINFEALGITADPNGDPYMENERKYSTSRDGFRNDLILMQIWTKEIFEQIQEEKKHEEERKEAEKRKLRGEFEDQDFFNDNTSQNRQQPTNKKTRLTLKSKHGEVKTRVRPNTVVAELITLFRVQQKISPDQDVVVSWDGEILDDETTMEELEIEDLDSLDVIVK